MILNIIYFIVVLFNLTASCYGKTKGDTVPFMLVVEHEGGIHCAGALVSLRSAMTSATCARLRFGQITVLTGPYLAGVLDRADGTRKIKTVVVPKGYVISTDFAGAVNDVAVLRLDKPFGSTKLVRPILMEKERTTYEAEGTMCNLVRIMQTPPQRIRREENTNKSEQPMLEYSKSMSYESPMEWLEDITESAVSFSDNLTVDVTTHLKDLIESEVAINSEISASKKGGLMFKELDATVNSSSVIKRSLDGAQPSIIFRIYDVTILNSDTCRNDNLKSGNHFWGPLTKQVICTTGTSFCQTDWGSGLVCDGKLSGLLSRVVHPAGQPIGEGCGSTQILQSTGRWKRFFDCAHDPGKCAEYACGNICEEIQLEYDKQLAEGNSVDEMRITPGDQSAAENKDVARKIKPGKKATVRPNRQGVEDDSSEEKGKNANGDKSSADSFESDSGMDLELDNGKINPNQKKVLGVGEQESEDPEKRLPELSDSSDESEDTDEMRVRAQVSKLAAKENSKENNGNTKMVTPKLATRSRRPLQPQTVSPVTTEGNPPTTTTKTTTTTTTTTTTSPVSVPRMEVAAEYEPYRPDFKTGDYGDNGLDAMDEHEERMMASNISLKVVTKQEDITIRPQSPSVSPPPPPSSSTPAAVPEKDLSAEGSKMSTEYGLLPDVPSKEEKRSGSSATSITMAPFVKFGILLACILQ